MNTRLVVETVTRIYTAAGRRAAETDFALWGEALADIDLTPDEAREIAVRYVRGVEPRELVNINGYREQVNAVMRQKRNAFADRHGLAEAPPTSSDEARANIARLKEMMSDIGRVDTKEAAQ